ncbi:MAG: hypothetical protein FIA92_02225 [Chloroflexi bacterium]|nr:hypothetical protein [Chloroflexota bacterium]
MQSAGSSRSLGRLGTLWLVAAILALAGCSGSLDSVLPGTGPLVTVRMEGGMCPEGMCEAAWVLHRDGRIVTDADPPQEVGRAGGDAMTALTAAVEAADYGAIRSRPFTGTCPTAYDGQEVVFEFHASSGVQRVASCEVEIDWTHPLFAATVAALSSVVSVPTDF